MPASSCRCRRCGRRWPGNGRQCAGVGVGEYGGADLAGAGVRPGLRALTAFASAGCGCGLAVALSSAGRAVRVRRGRWPGAGAGSCGGGTGDLDDRRHDDPLPRWGQHRHRLAVRSGGDHGVVAARDLSIPPARSLRQGRTTTGGACSGCARTAAPTATCRPAIRANLPALPLAGPGWNERTAWPSSFRCWNNVWNKYMPS